MVHRDTAVPEELQMPRLQETLGGMSEQQAVEAVLNKFQDVFAELITVMGF